MSSWPGIQTRFLTDLCQFGVRSTAVSVKGKREKRSKCVCGGGGAFNNFKASQSQAWLQDSLMEPMSACLQLLESALSLFWILSDQI